MILANTTNQGYASYNPGYVSLDYQLPESQVYLIEDWLKEIDLDLVEAVKIMMIPGKNFRTRPSGEYDTATLRTPYRFIALMLNNDFWESSRQKF